MALAGETLVAVLLTVANGEGARVAGGLTLPGVFVVWGSGSAPGRGVGVGVAGKNPMTKDGSAGLSSNWVGVRCSRAISVAA